MSMAVPASDQGGDATTLRISPDEGSLKPEEQTAISAVEARFSERARHPVTLDSLLAEWKQFVSEVEQGYALFVYEYLNDLTTRDLVEELLDSVPKSLQKKIAISVQPLDARFKAATEPDDDSRLSRYFRVRAKWWWRRIPTKLVGSLAEGLALVVPGGGPEGL